MNVFLFLVFIHFVLIQICGYNLYKTDLLNYEVNEKNNTSGSSRNEHSFPIGYHQNVHMNPLSEQIQDQTLQNYQLHNEAHLDRFTTLFDRRPDMYLPLRRRKKKKKFRKRFKHFIPLLITVVAKLVHLLPVAKMILLTLFALVLFAKKAFLVSVGTLLLVIYDHMYIKGMPMINFWKEGHRLSHDQPAKNDFEEENIEDDWWGRIEGNQTLKLNPREEDKWKRWWAPQIKLKRNGNRFKRNIFKKYNLNPEGLY